MTNFTPRVGKLFRCRNGTVVCITTLQRGKGDPGPEELDVYPIGVEVVVAAHTAWFASWPAAGQRLGYTAQGKFSASSSWPFEGFLELDIVGEAGAHEDLVTLPGLLGAEPEPKPAPTPKRVEFLALSEVPIDDLERAAGPRASGVGVGELTTFPRGLAHIEHNWPIPTVEHGNYGPFELGMELERRFEKQKADAYAIAHEARIQKNKVIIGQARRLGAMDRLEFRWLGASNNGGGWSQAECRPLPPPSSTDSGPRRWCAGWRLPRPQTAPRCGWGASTTGGSSPTWTPAGRPPPTSSSWCSTPKRWR